MPNLNTLKAGDALPSRDFTPTNVQLFLYNAALWNAHRIHYDEPYATGVEGYSALVIDGPLMGDWLTQCVTDWLGDDGDFTSISYANRTAAYLGETVTSGGTVQSVDADTGLVELEIYIKNQKDETIIPGTATVRLPTG
jgi:hydroxyacyl-ACP dehydratase HTD2-like protein with hotdog domain